MTGPPDMSINICEAPPYYDLSVRELFANSYSQFIIIIIIIIIIITETLSDDKFQNLKGSKYYTPSSEFLTFEFWL